MRLPISHDFGKYGLVTNHTAASTINGTSIDTRGFTYLTAFVMYGDVTATAAETITIKLQSDDNSGFSSATDITGATTGAVTVANAIDNTIRVIHGPINGTTAERYVRVTSINSGGSTACPVGVCVVLSNGPTVPAATGTTDYGAIVAFTT